MFRRIHALTLALVLALPAARGLADAGPLVLTLLHVNDVHGRVQVEDQAAGLARLATMVEEVRAEMPHVLLTDGGDTISGQPETILTGGEGVIAAMNAMRFDAMVVGNHEFDHGDRVAQRVLAAAGFDVLTANLSHARTGEAWPVARPYTVKVFGGARVGIVGATTPGTMDFQYPRGMGGYRVTDPVEAVRRYVEVLRQEERVDVVIALTHLGVRGDRQLAAEVPGIDVILGGHSHSRLEEQVWVNGTLVMQCGAHAAALGRADLLLEPRPAGGYRIASVNGRDGRWWGHDGVPAPRVGGAAVSYPKRVLHRPGASTPDHPAVAAAYAPYGARTRAYLEEVLAQVESPIPGAGARERETPLGNLLADAVRAHAGADVAVYASSQFKPVTLQPGPITMKDLYALLGSYTRQHIVSLRAPGRHVRPMLAAAAATPGEQPLHVSGVRVAPDGITLRDGSALSDDEVYRVAGAAHVMQEHLLGRAGVEVIGDDPEGANGRDALAALLRELGTVGPPAADRTQATPREPAEPRLSP